MSERDDPSNPDSANGSSTSAPLNFLKTTDGVVDQQALERARSTDASSPLGKSTPLVAYRSGAHCLIIGDTDQALEIAEKLGDISVSVLEPEAGAESIDKRLTETGVHVFRGPAPTIEGHLGAFSVSCGLPDRTIDLGVLRITDSGQFDQILDLQSLPSLSVRLKPFGYFHAPDDDAIATALEQIPELVGEFEKPRYFDYDETICAHSRSNLIGCSNCLDICVADAISPSGEGVSIDPYLCQGCGACASVCPSGALNYAWPRPGDAITRTRELFDQAAGKSVLVVYSGDDENPEGDQEFEQGLPPWVIAVAVEEVPAYGMDYWASSLSAGFEQVLLVMDAPDDHPNVAGLKEQASMLNTMLAPLGFPADTVSVESGGRQAVAPRLSAEPASLPGRRVLPAFVTHDDKRQTLRAAMDQLVELNPPATDSAALPEGSPFGKVTVNDACTLCMACVSVCPAGALLDGQGAPRLRFIESNCVQCGLCETACPEKAVTRESLYTYDSVKARDSKTLNEEEPFNCVRCHKPFATRKMIDTMSVKLASHWMFSDDKAVRRLKMCEDCRVIDMFEEDADGIDVHQGSPDKPSA